MKTCMHCGASLPEDAAFCPHCTEVLLEKERVEMPRVRKTRYGYLLLGAILVLALGCWGMFRPSPVEEPEEPDTRLAESGEDEAPTVQFLGTEPESTETVGEPTNIISTAYYTDEDGTYQLFLCYDTPSVPSRVPQSEREVSIPADTVTHVPSILAVCMEYSDEDVREEFMAKVASCQVEAIPVGDGVPMGVTEPVWSPDFEEGTRVSHVEMNSKNCETLIRWTLEMNSGEVIQLQHRLSVVETETLRILPTSVELNTMEDLQYVLDSVREDAELGTAVEIYLPGGVFEGDLHIHSHSVRIFGSTVEETVFRGTVYAEATDREIARIYDVTFEGPGEYGVVATSGIVLERCTLTDWGVAAEARDGGWVGVHECIFRDNEVGLHFNTMDFYYSDSAILNCQFEENGIAVRATRLPEEITLLFPGTEFGNNVVDIHNSSGCAMDYGGATFN